MTDDLLIFYWTSLLLLLGIGLIVLLSIQRLSLGARLGIAVLPPLTSIVAWNWYISLVVRPGTSEWSGARLAPALALLHGCKLYWPPDRGPVSGWIYTPVSLLCYMPATLLGDPTAMVLFGRMLSLLFYFGTVSWLLIREARSGRMHPVAAALLLVTFAFLTNETASLRYVSTEIIADNPALAFGTVSLSLVGLMKGASPGRRLAIAIGACAMAAWCKQPLVALLAVPALWSAWTGGWKGLRRCLWLSVVVVGGISLPIVLVFGPRELFFNTIVVPSRHPWVSTTLAGIWQVVLPKVAHARSLNAFLFLGLASAGILLYARWQGRRTKQCYTHIWLPFLLAGLFEVPLSVVGMLKVGGDVNCLSYALLYWTVAALLVFGRLSAQYSCASWLLLAIAVSLGAADGCRISSLLADQHPPWTDEVGRGMSWIEQHQMVVRYLKAHPGQSYFPYYPLEHLVVEGRLPHFEYGVFDRALADEPVSPDHMWRHIPPKTSLICYPAGRCWSLPQRSTILTLPEFDHTVEIDELPGCLCYQRNERAHVLP